MKLDKESYTFLLDSGCDRTLVPSSMVKAYDLRPTSCTVTAANGARIPLDGEVTIVLCLGDLRFRTEALVSQYVSEGLIGNEWLTANDCCWRFGQD